MPSEKQGSKKPGPKKSRSVKKEKVAKQRGETKSSNKSQKKAQKKDRNSKKASKDQKADKGPTTRSRSAYIKTTKSGKIVVKNRTTKESMSLKKYVQKGQPWGALDKLR